MFVENTINLSSYGMYGYNYKHPQRLPNNQNKITFDVNMYM